jgi:HEAT repeat protein
VDARASAAYDLGKLHIAEAIPALADALTDDPFVAQMALGALARFSDEELTAAGMAPAIVERVRARREA